ncbi:hypothetical protein K432DRAFT_320588 [Lepidopterella palustris CBS 459.81]|uniref:Inner kinetochore subunit AME1 domain-containing protein n=1 Tax=Lepidopterella palustris CBS 459.81 TaxID=1314670 RepID=A0A8E2JJ72_9PEZI|nr:hypothetical protein K432DRAFT_320588 [Lepidopterella palustris CBS 459.81]
MAPNDREERRRMRQRGAGTQLQNVNFGFTFGANANTKKTAAPTPRQRSSSANAPSRRQRSSSAAPGSSAKSGISKSIKTPRYKSPSSFVTPTVTGKRKRGQHKRINAQDKEQDELEQHDEAHMVSSQKKGIAGARAFSASTSPQDNIPDELGENDESHLVSSVEKMREKLLKSFGVTPASASRSIRSTKRPDIIKEGVSTTAEGNSLGTGSFGSNIGLDIIQEGVSAPPKGSSTITRSARDARISLPAAQTPIQRPTTRRSLQKSAVPSISAAEIPAQEDDGSVDELSPDNKYEPGRAEHPQRTAAQPAVEQSLFASELEETEEAAEEIDELSPDHHRTTESAARPRLPSQASTDRDSEGEDHEAEEEENMQPPRKRAPLGVVSQNTRGRATSFTAPTIAPRNPAPAKRTKPTSTKPKKPRQERNGTAVPITIYRLFQPHKHRSRTARDSAEDADADAASTSFRLAGVNGVDVLAQITEEILSNEITSAHEKSQQAPNAHLRSQFKRKRGVIQLFNASLSDRLFELTEAVDAGSHLKGRLRDKLKEKLRLREEFLSIRKQREELAVRMDEVRAEHKEWVTAKKAKDELNATMFDIESAMQRGREKARKEGREGEGPDVPLEMLLETVAKDVVANGGGGLLQNLESFNGVLESAAAVLEGRA